MKSKFVLVLALVMGIITTALFFQYMKQFDAEKASTVNVVKIIAAKEKIEKNTVITSDMLEEISYPQKNIHPQMITDRAEAEGKLATAMIEKGEPVMIHRLVSKMEENMYVSRKVREGFRAVSVGVNINQSVSNLIEPEDEVDVIFSEAKKAPGGEQKVDSVILLEKVRVLAVGRKLVLPEDTKEPYAEYSSVTLEVKQGDSLKLVNSAEQGNIHFVLYKRPILKETAQAKTTEKGS